MCLELAELEQHSTCVSCCLFLIHITSFWECEVDGSWEVSGPCDYHRQRLSLCVCEGERQVWECLNGKYSDQTIVATARHSSVRDLDRHKNSHNKHLFTARLLCYCPYLSLWLSVAIIQHLEYCTHVLFFWFLSSLICLSLPSSLPSIPIHPLAKSPNYSGWCLSFSFFPFFKKKLLLLLLVLSNHHEYCEHNTPPHAYRCAIRSLS